MYILTQQDKKKILKVAKEDMTIKEIVAITNTRYNLTYKLLVSRNIPFKRDRKPKQKREVFQMGEYFNWKWAKQVEPILNY
jgi:predicted nucleotidyltransferase